MDKYTVKILPAAFEQMDKIYAYIAQNLCAKDAAQNLLDKLDGAIRSLKMLPERGAVRKVGKYANKGYRQLLVDNFIIVYRMDTKGKRVIIVAVQYSRRKF
ncbi:MAG: type II toxin-antitoxin system RelE/ParE family toxin [Schwartzia sp.]|nr:type II toxin-antitoxin system RelE/ParE family toxin [Schwartzia sp. (in: firmicutes)]